MLARSKSVALLFSLLLAVAAPLVAQQATKRAPQHIHVIGASVSGGFEDGPLFGAKATGDSVSMQHMLKKWSDGEVKVTTHPTMAMWNLFQDPIGIGKDEIELAKKRKADLVIAVDFPFWFAYGYVQGDEAKARLADLETCIQYLTELRVPVVIGDLPNMQGAAVRMLKPRQIPSNEVLEQLNARLKKFADDNPLITLVPMAQIVKQLKVEGVKLPLKEGVLQTKPGALLQEDQLHATRLGMALLLFQLQDVLRAQFPKGHALHEQRWAFDDFAAAAGAEVELDTLREQAKSQKQKDQEKKQ
jgi:hypothetical protein